MYETVVPQPDEALKAETSWLCISRILFGRFLTAPPPTI